MLNVPKSHQDLLADETKAFAYLATSMPDGSPQLTCLWFNTDGEHILFNTGEARVKFENIQRDPRVAVLITDPANPYRYIQLRGKVEFSRQGAVEHTHALAHKYTGKDFNLREGDKRVKYIMTSEHVFAWG